MAEIGEWSFKGASLSDVTAQKEYGVSQDFIDSGIRAGQLEYRDSSIWGNPIIRILRSQLEKYIDSQLGSYLENQKLQTELRKITSEIASTKKRMTFLQSQKSKFEELINKRKVI